PFRDPRAPPGFAGDFNLYQDRAGVLWVGGSGRVFRIVPSEARGANAARDFTTYALEAGQPLVRVFTLYEDRAGVLWVGGFAGMGRLDEAGRVFRYVPLLQPSGGEIDAPGV